MIFSSRLPKDLSESPFFKALEEEKQKSPYIDLTVSSPLKAGILSDISFEYIEKKWTSKEVSAEGSLLVRQAICDYYASRFGVFSPEQIIISSGTSEAYSFLFKTFCDPGDVILTPMPGYPLLDTLANLEYLSCYPYFLDYNEESLSFSLDSQTLLSAPERAKILLLVSPHNPTGHVVSELEWKQIISFCEERSLVLVVDEVFGDYCYDGKPRSWSYDCGTVPVFWLNGLSKTVGNPHLKLSWMVFKAPEDQFEKIREALTFVADAYLSVSSGAQAAALDLLPKADSIQERVVSRLKQNLDVLKTMFPHAPIVQGGWYASICCEGQDDESLVLEILKENRLLVQPGFFFDFSEDGWLVISLLSSPEDFLFGLKTIAPFVNQNQ